MKQKLFLLAFATLVFVLPSKAQDYQDLVKIGDELIISSPVSSDYKYIDVPRKNFIIKRGGIANMKSLENRKTIVKAIDNRGSYVKVTLSPADGGKFFNVYRELNADLNGAIENGELIISTKSKRQSIAR
ncbi:hypothetical protein [Allomuricauda sp. SCSIO 65647]|uniref:hypothetical protein n=1 Tax=Allomuricauda sp. SCSIO 65647 TaxID=2908843 RepID=UPI001F3F27BD|nr:hypothetical protein [Muricauda sp. SCSIO 65647]UJH66166.1 hypothetical protein L0P89_09285 [Muricauda sp. SCSIO 65647]